MRATRLDDLSSFGQNGKKSTLWPNSQGLRNHIRLINWTFPHWIKSWANLSLIWDIMGKFNLWPLGHTEPTNHRGSWLLVTKPLQVEPISLLNVVPNWSAATAWWRDYVKQEDDVIKLLFIGNLEILDFPSSWNNKNRPFKKE